MPYLHADIETVQQSKHAGAVSGDVVAFERTPKATIFVLVDGVGSGIKAHMAATMAMSRLMGLLRIGFTPRQACERLAQTSEEAKAFSGQEPYVAFTLVRILGDGDVTILGYESPPPILVGQRAMVLPRLAHAKGQQGLYESHCRVEPGDALVVCSDGITQAGMGRGLSHGWGIEGVNACVNRALLDRVPHAAIPGRILALSQDLSDGEPGDDCTVVLLAFREARTLNILTGPPSNRRDDKSFVDRFMAQPGKKVVCGATTAQILARRLDVDLRMRPIDPSAGYAIAPPGYEIEGIDLATEGAVTLNQVYNLLDEDPEHFEGDEAGTLCRLLQQADRINLFMGTAQNPGHGHIGFIQRGILPRTTIVPLIQEKLRNLGQLVILSAY